MNAIIYRLIAHAHLGAPLVFDDADRYAVLDALSGAFRERLLAYCLLDERLDVIAEGRESDLRERLDRALRDYVRERQRRDAQGEPGIPARVVSIRVRDSRSLALAIAEVHALPLAAGRN